IPRTSSSGSCITKVSAYTSLRASSRVSRFVSVTISQERRARALFSCTDIYSFLLSLPLPPASCGSTELYCGDKRSSAHEPNALFLHSRGDALADSQRVACLYISETGLPPKFILGNPVSGTSSSRKLRNPLLKVF